MVNILQQDIEAELEKKKGTKAVILDASGIGSIDITAADRLAILYEALKEQGIRFYITEHIADLNEQMRKLGLGYLISEGCDEENDPYRIERYGNQSPVSIGRRCGQ